MKILFVCLGNICRSPLAEAIFKHKIKEGRLTLQFSADSCATSNYHIGDKPDARTIKNAYQNGISIDHLGRQFDKTDLEKFDLILAMDKKNVESILRFPNATLYKEKIRMIREYDPQAQGDVPDPYYGEEKDFQEVFFNILDRSIENLIDTMQSGA